MATTVASSDVDRSIQRARRRIIPFLVLMYVLAYLDRANVAYAKQAFQATTGVSEAAFAFAAVTLATLSACSASTSFCASACGIFDSFAHAVSFSTVVAARGESVGGVSLNSAAGAASPG